MRVLLLALAVLAAGGVSAAEPAEAWLSRMSHALATREYRGVFVYLHDGRIETLRVVRTIGPDGARDELVSLSGEPRGVVRADGELRSTGNGVTTVLPARNTIVFRVLPAELLGSASHYRLRVAGEDRVAGYAAAVVEARPTDSDRYGYRFWIERESGMLLRSVLAAQDGSAIEQLMFTTLELSPEPEPDPAALATAVAPTEPLEGPRFREALPQGFRLVAVPPVASGRHHYVYSDGIANVSLYVEPLASGLAPITGGLRRGAINLYGHVADDRQVVVVGDVPVHTAQRIAVMFDPASVR